MNQDIIVGRLATVNEDSIVLDISCPKAGDISLPIDMSQGLLNNLKQYSKRGSIIGIKAFNSIVDGAIHIVAEKLTMINTKKGDLQ